MLSRSRKRAVRTVPSLIRPKSSPRQRSSSRRCDEHTEAGPVPDPLDFPDQMFLPTQVEVPRRIPLSKYRGRSPGRGGAISREDETDQSTSGICPFSIALIAALAAFIVFREVDNCLRRLCR